MKKTSICRRTISRLTTKILLVLLAAGGFCYSVKAQRYVIYAQGPASCDAYTTWPDYLSKNAAAIESKPFDGVVVQTASGWNLMNGSRISYNTIAGDFAPLTATTFTKFKHNFAIAHITGNSTAPPDVFDAGWDNIIANYRDFAKVIKSKGFRGIVFDNELYPYTLDWYNYPDKVKYASTKTLDQYRAQARLRGKQLIQAVEAEFPDVVFYSYISYANSEPKTPPQVLDTPNSSYVADVASGYDLLGPLLAGMAEGKSAASTLVDGGEFYHLRTTDDFEASYQWRKYDIASSATNSAFIPSELRSSWSQKWTMGFMTYNLAYNRWQDNALRDMNPSIMRTTMENALRRSDKYVVAYVENECWLTANGMSADWQKAIADARASANATAPQGLANGIYKLTSKISAGGTPLRVLDVKYAQDADGTNVQLYTDNTSAAQRWYIQSTGDGYYKLVSQVGSKTRLLDATNGGRGNGSNVSIYSANATDGGSNQRWKIESTGDGYYKLTTKASATESTKYCLDVWGGYNVDGGSDPGEPNKGNVLIWQDNGGDNQRWKIEPATAARIASQEKNTTENSFVSLSPNPASESVTLILQARQAQTIVVNLINGKGVSIGQVRKAIPAGKQQVQIPLKGYHKGLYLLNVTVDGQRHIKKLLIN